MINLKINDKDISVEDGSTILEAAKKVNINIPTLCHLDLHGLGLLNQDANCRVCMVEPTFEEMKDYITDDQMVRIFQYAIGGLNAIESFRKDKEDGTDNNTSTEVSKKTK